MDSLTTESVRIFKLGNMDAWTNELVHILKKGCMDSWTTEYVRFLIGIHGPPHVLNSCQGVPLRNSDINPTFFRATDGYLG